MQIMVEEILAGVNCLLEMNLQVLLDMRRPVTRVEALVLQGTMSGEAIEEVRVTARVQVTLPLDTLIGQLTQESTCSLL